MSEIIVDENGYKQFFEELENLKRLSLINASASSEAYNNAVGDGWHDNFAFEESMRESRTIANRIDKMLEIKKNLKVIKKEKIADKNIINLDDILIVEIKYFDNIEKANIKITGNYLPNDNLETNIQEITLNSPLGKALYKRNINDKEINYCVNNTKVYVKIIKKLNNEGRISDD